MLNVAPLDLNVNLFAFPAVLGHVVILRITPDRDGAGFPYRQLRDWMNYSEQCSGDERGCQDQSR